MRPEKTALDCLSMSLEELGLPRMVRYHLLNQLGITTVRELVLRTEGDVLGATFSETRLREAQQPLGEVGLRLGMRFKDGTWTFGDEP